MHTDSFSSLDQTELIQLALNATRNNDAGAALSYLKAAVARPDATAIAHFLLGAEYAQIKMYDRALPEMEAAIALDPSLSIARFQLGLLLLTSGDGARASETLQPLCDRDASYLSCFSAGLVHLIRDEFPETIDFLRQGIKLNVENPALNTDMQKIIDQTSKLLSDPSTASKEENTEENADGQHLFISAYTGKTSH